jgi:hypothetical protein
MPRKAGIDAPGALHHIIIRGIERKAVFKDNADRENFIERLGRVISETDTGGYAWVLMKNHIHMLLKTGLAPIATVMRRLLTGYIAVRKLGYRCTEVSKAMDISAVTVNKAVSLSRELPEINKIIKQILDN